MCIRNNRYTGRVIGLEKYNSFTLSYKKPPHASIPHNRSYVEKLELKYVVNHIKR